MSFAPTGTRRRARAAAIAAFCVAAIALAAAPPARTAPVADDASPDPALRAAARIDDLYVFPVSDPTQVAFAITVGAPLQRGIAGFAAFDPRVLYAIHIDNVGDFHDHLTIGFRADPATPPGPRQRIVTYGPVLPAANGDTAGLLAQPLGGGFYNQTTILDKGVVAFAGLRRDPYFFDAVRFAQIRAGSVRCFAPPGSARNAFVYDNVLAIVFTAPKTLIAPRKRGRIGVWATASLRIGGGAYAPVDRAGRAHVRTFFGLPPEGSTQLVPDPAADDAFARAVTTFTLAGPPSGAGRAPDTAAALGRILVPDELEADIEAPNPAAYLGIEAPDTPAPSPTPSQTPSPAATATPTVTPLEAPSAPEGFGRRREPPGALRPPPGPTPKPTPYRPFGGRAPSDPAMAVLGDAVYGSLVARAHLAPDDGRETPCLTNDGTTAPRNLTAGDFPYLDAPF